MRTQGATPGQVVAALGFQAAALGVAASTVGLVIGDVLSRTVFHSVPGYLAFTFPIGTQRVVPFTAVAIAFGAGVVAALLAAGRPLADVFSRGDIEAAYEEGGEPGEGIGGRLRSVLLGAALLLSALVATLVTIVPGTAIIGVVVLIVATLLAMPALFVSALWVVERIATALRLRLLMIAVMGARSSMTRSVAVAAIAATAMIGNIAIGGAREDLVRGLEAGYHEHLSTADIWVTTRGRSLTTDSFELSRTALSRVRQAPGVSGVRTYQGGMFDTGARRLWLIARPPQDRVIVPPSQTIHGEPDRAAALIRHGGWAALSGAVADERRLHVGDAFELPTPTGPIELRLAAVVTNLSWGPGAVIVNSADYRRAWRTSAPSALEVDLEAGVSAAAGKREVARALGPRASALDVQTSAELEHEFRSLLYAGLTRLNQISTMMLVASALALAAAMSAAVWERRRLLATYKLEGVKKRQLGGMLLLEGVLLLGVGCAVGAAAGVYGHVLGNRWLELTTGFPAPFSMQVEQALLSLVSILIASLAIVAVPGYVAARVPARLRFQD
jgi:putative ABC transport system permease protein